MCHTSIWKLSAIELVLCHFGSFFQRTGLPQCPDKKLDVFYRLHDCKNVWDRVQQRVIGSHNYVTYLLKVLTSETNRHHELKNLAIWPELLDGEAWSYKKLLYWPEITFNLLIDCLPWCQPCKVPFLFLRVHHIWCTKPSRTLLGIHTHCIVWRCSVSTQRTLQAMAWQVSWCPIEASQSYCSPMRMRDGCRRKQ